MAITDWTIIRRSLTGRAFSSLGAAGVVAVGVGLVLVLVAARDSGRQAFERGRGNMSLLVTREDSPLVGVLNNLYYAGAPRRPIDEPTRTRLETSFPFEWTIPTQIGDSYRSRPVVATTTEFFTKFEPNPNEAWRFREGRAFNEPAPDMNPETQPFELVAGSEAARAAGLAIGNTISVTHGAPGPGGQLPEGAHTHNEYQFEVVGILEPTGSAHDRALFTSLTASWTLHAHDRRLNMGETSLTTPADLIAQDRLVTAMFVKLPTREGRTLSAALQAQFDRLRRDPTITVSEPSQEVRKLFDIVGNIDKILIGLAGAVLVSGGFTIMLTLYTAMEQRRRQIATLRVLGCSKARVFGLVLTESAILGLVGAVMGVALGFVGFGIVAEALYQRTGIVIQPSLSPPLALGIVMGAAIIAALAGLIPAVAAYKTSVIRSLRPIG